MKNSKKSTIAILGGWDKPEDHLYDEEPEETLEFSEEDIEKARMQAEDTQHGGE